MRQRRAGLRGAGFTKPDRTGRVRSLHGLPEWLKPGHDNQLGNPMKDQLIQVLEQLTTDQKHELDAHGIPASRRSEWKNGKRLPSAAQLQTLAIVADVDPVPLLLWLARREATPAQLDLFLKALAKTTAALAVVILAGAENHADAASMRVTALTDNCIGNAHYAQLVASNDRPPSAPVGCRKR